jgi:hypothetical protein
MIALTPKRREYVGPREERYRFLLSRNEAGRVDAASVWNFGSVWARAERGQLTIPAAVEKSAVDNMSLSIGLPYGSTMSMPDDTCLNVTCPQPRHASSSYRSSPVIWSSLSSQGMALWLSKSWSVRPEQVLHVAFRGGFLVRDPDATKNLPSELHVRCQSLR